MVNRQKYGSLVQHGVNYMVNFSQFADTFVEKYYEYKLEILENGYSLNYELWLNQNSENISLLYDSLKNANLIPTS